MRSLFDLWDHVTVGLSLCHILCHISWVSALLTMR